MAGTKKFKLDAYLTGLTGANFSQGMFKQIWDFFKQLEVAGYTTEIARNNGSGGTGTDFYDGANPFGTHAWALFRFNTNINRNVPYYVLFQFSTTNTFGTSPGSPGKINGGTGVNGINIGFQIAVAYDSLGVPANPWGGTTGSLGSDTKGSPVWVAPVGGKLFVYPRSNSSDATYASNKEDMAGYTNTLTTNSRMCCIADADNFAIVINRNSATTENIFFGTSFISVLPEITETLPPICFWVNTTGEIIDRTNTWGTLTGAVPSGGSPIGEGTNHVSFGWGYGLELGQPNTMLDSSSKYAAYPVSVNSRIQQIGFLDTNFWKVCYGLVPKDTNLTLAWMVFGNTTTANTVKILLPWDGATTRGTGTARDGVIS